jgi:hypothetical protein
LVKKRVIRNVKLPLPSACQAEGGGNISGLTVVLGRRHLDSEGFTFAKNVELMGQRLVKCGPIGHTVGRSA